MCINDAGFSSGKTETIKACCGVGEPYNVDVNVPCGYPAVKICLHPSNQINWDGTHYTEAAYREMAKGLVEGPFTNPPLKSPPFKIA